MSHVHWLCFSNGRDDSWINSPHLKRLAGSITRVGTVVRFELVNNRVGCVACRLNPILVISWVILHLLSDPECARESREGGRTERKDARQQVQCTQDLFVGLCRYCAISVLRYNQDRDEVRPLLCSPRRPVPTNTRSQQ